MGRSRCRKRKRATVKHLCWSQPARLPLPLFWKRSMRFRLGQPTRRLSPTAESPAPRRTCHSNKHVFTECSEWTPRQTSGTHTSYLLQTNPSPSAVSTHLELFEKAPTFTNNERPRIKDSCCRRLSTDLLTAPSGLGSDTGYSLVPTPRRSEGVHLADFTVPLGYDRAIASLPLLS